MSIVSENLKMLRKKHNLSQEDLARHLDITSQGYSRYERAQTEPNIEKLIKLSRLYSITVDELIGNDIDNELGSIHELKAKNEIIRNMDNAIEKGLQQFIKDHKEEIVEYVKDNLK